MNNMKNIINESNGAPVLENALGCRLVPFHDGVNWGLGTFCLNDVPLGGTIPFFAVEEFSKAQYRAQRYEIVENSPEKGVLRFHGKDGKLGFSVTVTMTGNSCACRLEYDFDPLHPIFHPLYIPVPFFSEYADFVKYPYEDTIRGSDDRYAIRPDRSRAPFIFGSETIEGRSFYIGAGYDLKDPFHNGRIEYAPDASPDMPFRIYTPFEGMARAIDLQCVTRLELLRADLTEDMERSRHKFHVVISAATNQYDCIRGYIEKSGYDTSVTMRHSIDRSVSALMDLYKNTKGYVRGKGYHQLIRFDTGDFDTTVPHGWYSKYIVTGPQILLAYELYKYWQTHQEESWARERAIEMADFLIEMQEDCGAFTNWDTDVGGTSIMHPNDVEGTKFNSCIYSISDMGIGLYHFYLLYNEMKAFEGIDNTHWKQSIDKAVYYMAGLVGENGELGRNYNLQGDYDKLTSGIIEALQVFDLACRQNGDEKLGQVRDRLENWLYDTFIKVNDWCNGSVDGGAWQGHGWPPPHNNDLMGVFTFAAYCVDRYMNSREDRYLQMAKDAVGYIWLSVSPIEIPGFTHGTRTLVREQDFYSIYGVLIRGNDSIECLPFLSKITGDPFFMQFYRIIIQNQIDYQDFNMPYAGFHIGLECDSTGREPIDKFAEGNNGYIVRFASEFLKSVNNPMAYRYVGGEGWGLGADYNLAFDPDFGENAPYILCASTMVRDAFWDREKAFMRIFLYDQNKRSGYLEIKWRPDIYPVSCTCVRVDGKTINASEVYDQADQVIHISYRHDEPSKVVEIFCRK